KSSSERVGHEWTLPESRARVFDVEWSPDGTRCAACVGDSVVRVWDFAPRQMLSESRGTRWLDYKLDWSPDSQLVAITSDELFVRVLEAATGREGEGYRHPDVTFVTFGVTWAKSGAFLVVGSEQGAVVWDTRHLVPAQA